MLSTAPAPARNPLRRGLRALGSLWFAAVLLTLLLICMASATAYESLHGSAQALSTFYLSWWFEGLLALLAVNLTASLLARWPFSRRLAGFVVTHTAIIVILVGALVTQSRAIDGFLRLGEGETQTHAFDASQQVLVLANARTGAAASLSLPRAVFGGFDRADRPGLEPVTRDGVQVTVERYLPDSEQTRVVTEETDSQLPPAIELTLGIMGQRGTEWLLANRAGEIAGTQVAFRVVRDEATLARMVAGGADAQPRSAGTLKVVHQEQNYDFPLERLLAEAAPIGDSGYSVRVLNHWPHATVGPDNRLMNDPARPLNPALEAEITGNGTRETRVAFANFPGFRHGGDASTGLELTFVATGAEIAPLAPVEILAGPQGQHIARISWPGLPSIIKPLEPGELFEPPWPGGELKIGRRYAHAREEVLVNPIEPVREERNEAVQLRLTLSGQTQTRWLQKDHSLRLRDGDALYDIAYTNRQVPLGFAVTLRQFRLGLYPGGRAPRSFESTVDFADPDTGRVRGAVVTMNAPATHGGFTFLQSSYEQRENENVTVLRVTRDPGQPLAFLGYGLLFAGLVTMFFTRLGTQSRKLTAVPQ